MAITGIKALRRLQMGAEDTPGTAVDPTTYWRGLGTIQENRVVVFPEEDIGIFPGTFRNYAARADAILELESTEAAFAKKLNDAAKVLDSVAETLDQTSPLP